MDTARIEMCIMHGTYPGLGPAERCGVWQVAQTQLELLKAWQQQGQLGTAGV